MPLAPRDDVTAQHLQAALRQTASCFLPLRFQARELPEGLGWCCKMPLELLRAKNISRPLTETLRRGGRLGEIPFLGSVFRAGCGSWFLTRLQGEIRAEDLTPGAGCDEPWWCFSILGLGIKSPQDLSISVLVGESFPSWSCSQVGRGDETKGSVGKGLWV